MKSSFDHQLCVQAVGAYQWWGSGAFCKRQRFGLFIDISITTAQWCGLFIDMSEAGGLRPLNVVLPRSLAHLDDTSRCCGHWGLNELQQCGTLCTWVGHPVYMSGTPCVHEWDTPCTAVGHPVYSSGTPYVHEWDTLCTWVGHPVYVRGTPRVHECGTLRTWVGHPVYMSETPCVHECGTLCTWVGHPVYMSRTPCVHEWDTLCTWVGHPVYMSRTPCAQQWLHWPPLYLHCTISWWLLCCEYIPVVCVQLPSIRPLSTPHYCWLLLFYRASAQ